MFLDKKTLLKIWFTLGLSGNWAPEYQLKESGLPLTTRIQKPSSNDKWNEIIKKKNYKKVPMRKTGIQYLESRIHGVKSTIQDCHGFPRTGRNKGTGNKIHLQWQFYFISRGSTTWWATYPCSFFGPNLHDFDFLFSTSWTLMARQTLAIRLCKL